MPTREAVLAAALVTAAVGAAPQHATRANGSSKPTTHPHAPSTTTSSATRSATSTRTQAPVQSVQTTEAAVQLYVYVIVWSGRVGIPVSTWVEPNVGSSKGVISVPWTASHGAPASIAARTKDPQTQIPMPTAVCTRAEMHGDPHTVTRISVRDTDAPDIYTLGLSV